MPCRPGAAHSQRLVSVQSMIKQTCRYRTLERDLMDLTERKLFEYFLVVALHKVKAGVPYLPEVTQQFPLKVRGAGLGQGGGLTELTNHHIFPVSLNFMIERHLSVLISLELVRKPPQNCTQRFLTFLFTFCLIDLYICFGYVSVFSNSQIF